MIVRHKTTTISDIYTKYQIPPNLQKHQLRVAYVCNEIINKWIDSSINEPEIVEAALFHDMGNLIKFNFADPSMLEGEDPETWREIQKIFIKRYGSHVHRATLSICQEIGLPQSVIQTIRDANWDDVPQLIAAHDIPAVILIYADMRVAPFGITSYHNRITDLQKRSPSNQYSKRLEYAKKIEQTIQPYTRTRLSAIDDAKFNSFRKKMRSYQIQAA